MKKKLKLIPKFKNEDEERDFWDTHDTTEYFDMSKPMMIKFPNLKMSTKTITFRITQSLYDDLKILANKNDVPYQSLMKMFLAQKVREEFAQK
ncbi:hypothetical protein CO005_03685 [Candidatus Roizmanbacteria bacterium CG_4_8_14_3_um_filter_34_9]|uniref:Uncharacterized protein n=3 Tax=Candidatus Roizmaniibacteriota TaxID=1752723 RepID=A0A2M7AVJ5_9BACT|nr:MAG: hypothetical protein COT02_00555 [Candidatus Roizmanbacteria bacterium CG07_land_8_20_14_0_80_34_15]PIU74599.1 MAG: hypothetical protein COS77_00670 [Candidatus Roizmanbacteria bacterium CG06_land_8_20_14_3_00_34_14]PIW73037.1 MAG: hypothetical protein CO005_03685 [Candidatus Roizmanbacteria bacterium CG_4_8_14_3_um_filter_34_9]